MTSTNYQLMSYNTSWVLDCSSNQFNDMLSESADIIAKMAYIKNKPYDKLFDENYNTELDTFRLALADKATEYIKSKMDAGYDFLALIEQTMHLPKGDHANYDNHGETSYMKNAFDLGEKNKEYGFLRRMGKLKLDTTNPKGQGYIVAYDNCINRAFMAGEGIAILYKESLVETPLTWDQSKNPNSTGVIDFKKTGFVNFYSDDLGPIICMDGNKNVLYAKSNGVSDEGRPIILTGGVSGNTLNLFMAAHGPNILNLFENKPEFKKLVAEEKKLVAEDDATNVRKKNIAEEKQKFSVKKFDDQKITELFKQSGAAISGFVQKAIDGCSNKEIMQSVTKCQLFIGGDFNDALGYMLSSILTDGIKLKLKQNNAVKELPITFTYTGLDDTSKAGDDTSNVEKTKAKYSKLFSCCANADSVLITTNSPTLGPIRPDNETMKTNLIARLKSYPQDFYNPDNFGYNGDYALFGTSDGVKSNYEIKLDDNTSQKYTENGKTVIVSDHLPVISNVTTTNTSYGGGKRRHKTLARRKNNRRTRRKKNITKRNRRR